jgi:zinc/manganese transport system substrate-binding protein/manganese/iron transport system substrate-binding protein
VRAVARAQAIFVNGAGLESWLNDLIGSAGGSHAPLYTLSEGLQAVVQTASGTERGNPHFWLDPTDAIRYVRRIEQGLSERDPAHASDYRANADRYAGQIQQFDAWAQQQIDRIPPQRRKLVTFHDAFPYFGQHFGLEVVGTVERSPGQEPSARQVADLIDRVKALKVGAIFNEPQFSPKLTNVLAQEAGIKTLTLYTESPPAGDDYLAMMRRNVMTLVEGLL